MTGYLNDSGKYKINPKVIFVFEDNDGSNGEVRITSPPHMRFYFTPDSP